jgi:hypothetical protein
MAEEPRNVTEKAEDEDVHSFSVDEFVSVSSMVQLDDDLKANLGDSYTDNSHFGPIVKLFCKQLEQP